MSSQNDLLNEESLDPNLGNCYEYGRVGAAMARLYPWVMNGAGNFSGSNLAVLGL